MPLGALALVAAFAGGYAIANGHTVIRTRILTRSVPAPAVTDTRVVYRVRHRKHHAAPASPAASGPALTLGCKVLQTAPFMSAASFGAYLGNPD